MNENVRRRRSGKSERMRRKGWRRRRKRQEDDEWAAHVTFTELRIAGRRKEMQEGIFDQNALFPFTHAHKYFLPFHSILVCVRCVCVCACDACILCEPLSLINS